MNDKDSKIILDKISNIEEMIEEMNQNIRILLKENNDSRNEKLLLMTRFENLADFIKNQYNVVIEESKEYLGED